MRSVGSWKCSATSLASVSSRGSLWHGISTPTQFPGAACWHNRATSAESIPPLRPKTKPRAADSDSRRRSHSTMESVRVLISPGLYRASRGMRSDADVGHALGHPEEGVHDAGVELAIALLVDFLARVCNRAGPLVEALATA